MNTVEYLLNAYKTFDLFESGDLGKFRLFTDEYGIRIYDRTPNQPVITASAVVVNTEFTHALLTHHKLHGFYKQFGGHADGNPDLPQVASDELFDESGANGALLTNYPIDLIRWDFPDRTKGGIYFPAHDCFDIAFLFMMSEKTKLKPNKNEALDTKWVSLDEWRDYSAPNNPTYQSNPQNFEYQQRIYKKIKIFERIRKR